MAIFLILMETLVLHILVARWSELIAWILTISSLYVSIQLFAHIKAMLQRPIEITDGKLHIRYGLFGDTEIGLDNIESVEFSNTNTSVEKGTKKLALFGDLEQTNTKITLKQEETLNGFYGFTSKYNSLLFYVDERDEFKKLIEQNDNS